MKLTYFGFFLIVSCNCKSKNNLIVGEKNNQFGIVNNILQENSNLNKNYVFVIESEKDLSNREILFKNFNVSNDLFLSDSIEIRNAIKFFLLSDLKIIDEIMIDTSSSKFNFSLIFEKHPFESFIEKWYRLDNKKLIMKTLIYDYFMGGRTLNYFKRKEDISKIDSSFDLDVFAKWFSENRKLDLLSIKKDFNKKFSLTNNR